MIAARLIIPLLFVFALCACAPKGATRLGVFDPITPAPGADAHAVLIKDDNESVWKSIALAIAPEIATLPDQSEAGPGAINREPGAQLAQALRARGTLDPNLRPMRGSGLWVLRLTREEFERARATWEIIGGVERAFVDAQGQWRVALIGTQTPQTIRTDLGETSLGPGSMRLLARAWLAPTVTSSGALDAEVRIDLLPQHIARSPRDLDEGPRVPSITDEGQTLRRMLTSLPRTDPLRGPDPRVVYLLIEGGQDARWLDAIVALARADAQPDPAPDDSAPGEQPEDPPIDPAFPLGPTPSQVPSVGAALLPTADYAGGRLRRVLVLIPRGPAAWRIPTAEQPPE